MRDGHVKMWKKHVYRQKVKFFVFSSYALLFIAAIWPVACNYDIRPAFETPEMWFQRSGAVMTVFAFLAITVRDFPVNPFYSARLLDDQLKADVLSEFDVRFNLIFALGFCLTAIGTIIWGYGDTAYKIAASPDTLSVIFGLGK